jgi:hypothetical protein
MSEDHEYFLIPINGSIDRSVAVPLSQQTLADQALVEKLVAALASEAAPLDNWHRLAIELFRRGHTTKFQQIAGFLFTPEAEHALKTIYAKSQPALIKLLACLIAFHACKIMSLQKMLTNSFKSSFVADRMHQDFYLFSILLLFVQYG